MKETRINCETFELLLSDYLEGCLDAKTQSQIAQHALQCPLCHDLLNDTKLALQMCKEIPIPEISLAELESKVISSTVPDALMSCEEFEEYLTDYLDGFLPAPTFHRWERHALICNKCTDLPGLVVRSIATCYAFKEHEIPVSEELIEKILKATSYKSQKSKFSLKEISALSIFRRCFSQLIPQIAPVVTMILFAVFILMQTAEGRVTYFYQKSLELASQTYRQSASIVLGEEEDSRIEPIKQR